MSKGVVGSMSTFGWITDPVQKLDRLFTYFFANRRNQCIIEKWVYSYQYTRQKYNSLSTKQPLLEDMQEQLKAFIVECFDEAHVVCKEDPSTEGKSNWIMNISGYAVEDGVRYDFAESIVLGGSTYELIGKGRRDKNV